VLRGPVADAPQARRVEDAIEALERRPTPRRGYYTVDFGALGTSGTFSLKGLPWVTLDTVAILTPTSAVQGAAGLRIVVTTLTKGTGLSGSWYSTTALSGLQRLGLIAC
jgi:hypothetical protein